MGNAPECGRNIEYEKSSRREARSFYNTFIMLFQLSRNVSKKYIHTSS